MRVVFLGWQPPVPAGRDFDLYGMLPQKNRDEDTSGDLARFISLFQEVADLLLYDVDRFPTIADLTTAPDDVLDAMRDDLGDPFDFDLATIDKRRLLAVLLAIYKEKGTSPGMVNAVRFFMALTITITEIGFGTWVLGQSQLDVNAELGSSDPAVLNTFDVNVTTTITAAQVAQVRAICEYMKPAPTHLRNVSLPFTPPPYNPLVLGVSRLDTDWDLH